MSKYKNTWYSDLVVHDKSGQRIVLAPGEEREIEDIDEQFYARNLKKVEVEQPKKEKEVKTTRRK